jgi:hypothetical protein
MILHRIARIALTGCVLISLAACGGGFGSGGLFGGKPRSIEDEAVDSRGATVRDRERRPGQSKIWDLFTNSADPNTTLEVNRYLWTASLDVLNFLPIESVDPFSGVIVTGYGTPPGGGRAYRATVYVQDPALDARSLRVAMQTRGGGAVDPATIRAVEDAILTRARQLRIQDGKL